LLIGKRFALSIVHELRGPELFGLGSKTWEFKVPDRVLFEGESPGEMSRFLLPTGESLKLLGTTLSLSSLLIFKGLGNPALNWGPPRSIGEENLLESVI